MSSTFDDIKTPVEIKQNYSEIPFTVYQIGYLRMCNVIDGKYLSKVSFVSLSSVRQLVVWVEKNKQRTEAGILATAKEIKEQYPDLRFTTRQIGYLHSTGAVRGNRKIISYTISVSDILALHNWRFDTNFKQKKTPETVISGVKN